MDIRTLNKLLQDGNDKIMSLIFNDIFEEIKDRRNTMIKLYEEYGAKVPIKERPIKTGKNANKANNMISVPYRNMIVNQGLAYAFSKPISTTIEGDQKDNPQFQKVLKDFKVMNNLQDLDYSSAFYAAICGYVGRLLYLDTNAQVRVMNIKPWECHFIYDKTLDQIQYAMIHYDMEVIEGDNIESKKKLKYIEWYDSENVTFYRQKSSDSNEFEKYDLEDGQSNPRLHQFSGVPLFKIVNNDMELGDFEIVRDMIDAFDRCISDAQNEIEDYRNAYMIFKGIQPDEQTMKEANETGGFGSSDTDWDVSFLTKTLSGEFLENQKNTLNSSIYKHSNRVDMQDESFSGSGQSGESRKWKLLGLENDATIKENKFQSGLRTMYRLCESIWTKKNQMYQGLWLDIKFTFTRNLPVDLGYYGDVLTKYFGKFPLARIYALLPFVDDPQAAVKELEEENSTLQNPFTADQTAGGSTNAA